MKQKLFLSGKNIVFRRWTRKAYAVFNSLHKQVSIGVLLTAYSIVQSGSGFAQVDTLTQNKEPEQLDEVVIESEAAPEAYSEIARVVQVITKKEINRLPVSNVHQLLDYAANIDVRSRNSGIQSDVSIKGGTFDQTLILINGIPFNDPQSGHHNLNLPFDLDDVEQIEILQGPASKIFGPNAYSGVINFIINKSKKNREVVAVKVSDFKTFKSNVLVSLHKNKFSQYISASTSKSDGYIYNTAYETKNIFLESAYNFNEKNRLSLMFSFLDKDFGANSFYHWASLDQNERIRNLFTALNFKGGTKLKYNINAYWRKNFDTYYWKPEYSPNLTQTNIYGLDFKSRFYSNFGKTDFGLSAKYENMYSNKMGIALNDSIPVAFEKDLYYYYGKNRQNINAFINQSGSYNNFYFSIGANANYNTSFNDNYASGIELAYQLNSVFRPYVSVNSAYRLPTFFDLYYKSYSSLGDTSLSPETSVSYEAGIKFHKNIVRGNISFFYIQSKNAIDWVRNSDNSTTPYIATNIADLTTTGVDFYSQIDLQKIYDNPVVNLIKIDLSFASQNKALNDNLISKYAQTYLRTKVGVMLNHKIYKNLSATWDWVYKDRYGYFDYYKTGEKTEYKPYNLFNGRIYYKLKNFNFFIEANNIFDVEYFDMGSLPQPGRWFGGGIKYSR